MLKLFLAAGAMFFCLPVILAVLQFMCPIVLWAVMGFPDPEAQVQRARVREAAEEARRPRLTASQCKAQDPYGLYHPECK